MLFGYSGKCLEQLQAARTLGLRTIVEQTIAPLIVEERLLEIEHGRFPEWDPYPSGGTCAMAYADRERAEWSAADIILCDSDFVRRGIAEAGGPVERCRVVFPTASMPASISALAC